MSEQGKYDYDNLELLGVEFSGTFDEADITRAALEGIIIVPGAFGQEVYRDRTSTPPSDNSD